MKKGIAIGIIVAVVIVGIAFAYSASVQNPSDDAAVDSGLSETPSDDAAVDSGLSETPSESTGTHYSLELSESIAASPTP